MSFFEKITSMVPGGGEIKKVPEKAAPMEAAPVSLLREDVARIFAETESRIVPMPNSENTEWSNIDEFSEDELADIPHRTERIVGHTDETDTRGAGEVLVDTFYTALDDEYRAALEEVAATSTIDTIRPNAFALLMKKGKLRKFTKTKTDFTEIRLQ